MRSFLLTWNPDYWCLDAFAAEVAEQGDCEGWWTTQSRQIREGDLLYLLRQGVEPRGIVGLGVATGPPEPYPWPTSRVCVPGSWTELLPDEPLVRTAALQDLYPSQNWTPRCSGIIIKPPVDELLAGMLRR